MKFLVEYYINNNGELYNPCGTEYTTLIHDLKTLRGVKNRIMRNYIPKGVVKIDISTYTNLYNNDTIKKLDTIYL